MCGGYKETMTVTALLDLHVTEEARATALQVIEGVLVATRAFPGNLGVEVVVDVVDDTHFLAVERWASLADDDAYRAWRATPEGASALGSILAGPPSLTRYASAD
jgi:quinol monooxygenase YgiN